MVKKTPGIAADRDNTGSNWFRLRPAYVRCGSVTKTTARWNDHWRGLLRNHMVLENFAKYTQPGLEYSDRIVSARTTVPLVKKL